MKTKIIETYKSKEEAIELLDKLIKESYFKKEDFTDHKLRELTYDLMEGLDITDWIDPELEYTGVFTKMEIFGHDYTDFIHLVKKDYDKFCALGSCKIDGIYLKEMLDDKVSWKLIEMIREVNRLDIGFDYSHWLKDKYTEEEAVKDFWEKEGYCLTLPTSDNEDNERNQKCDLMINMVNMGVYLEDVYYHSIELDRLKLIKEALSLGVYKKEFLGKDSPINDLEEIIIKAKELPLNVEMISSYTVDMADHDYDNKMRKAFFSTLMLRGKIRLNDEHFKRLSGEQMSFLFRECHDIYYLDWLERNLSLEEMKEEQLERKERYEDFWDRYYKTHQEEKISSDFFFE